MSNEDSKNYEIEAKPIWPYKYFVKDDLNIFQYFSNPHKIPLL